MSGHPKGESSGKKILCVEDDEDTCEAVAEILRRPGHEVVTAYTVAEGLRSARAGDFDLVILDNWFRVGDGIELCRRIREFDAEVKIMFYSAAAYEKDIEAGLRAGADAYIVKPEFDRFQQAVNEMLNPGREGKD